MFSVLCDCHVKPNAVKPGAELCLSSEFRIGVPKLDNNFLEQILPIFIGVAIQTANLIDHPLMLLDQLFKRLM
jgi:hypothetical protein